MQVSHVMRRDVVTITADQTLQNAAATMRLFDVGVLPVEEGNKLIGIVTERDIAIRGVADGMGPDAKVRDVMTYEVKCCFEDEDIGHVVDGRSGQRGLVGENRKRVTGDFATGWATAQSRSDGDRLTRSLIG